MQHYLFFYNINFIFLHYLEFSCFLFYICEEFKHNHIDLIPCEIDPDGVRITFYKVIRALASSKTCTTRFCISSNSSSTLPSTSLKHQGTKGIRNPAKHRHQGIRAYVATGLLAPKRTLANLVRSRAEAKIRPPLRHMRCTSPIIMTPMQVLQLMVCFLFPVLRPMFYLIMVHYIPLYSCCLRVCSG